MTVDPIDPMIPGPEALRPQVGADSDGVLERSGLRLIEGGLSETKCDDVEQISLLDSKVRDEVKALRAEGYDVNIVYPEQQIPYDETTEKVRAVTNGLAGVGAEHAKSVLFDRVKYKAQSIWHGLSKRAIALHTLYLIDRIQTLGEGISADIYERPMFNGRSAHEILIEQRGAKKADEIMGKYRDFVDPDLMLEDNRRDEHGLTQREYLGNVIDSRAVRSRARVASDVIKSHFARRRSNGDNRPIRIASLACGAAGPVYGIVSDLEAEGHVVEEIKLVDGDPMALATAKSYGESLGVEGKLQIELRNLITEPITNYIDKHRIKVVDFLGFFEYTPTRITATGLAKMGAHKLLRSMQKWAQAGPQAQEAERHPIIVTARDVAMKGLKKFIERPERKPVASYKAAADILGSLKDIMEPGGIIVFGNMLDERPDQEFFEAVWPKLHQRSVRQVLDIIADAGFDPMNDVTVDIPGEEGVYAVYTIRIPDTVGSPEDQKATRSRRTARWLMKQVIGDY